MNIIPCVCTVAQLCLTLCDSMDWSLSGFSINGMGLSQHEYWSGLPFPPPGDLPNPGIEPAFPGSAAVAGGFFYHWAIWGVYGFLCCAVNLCHLPVLYTVICICQSHVPNLFSLHFLTANKYTDNRKWSVSTMSRKSLVIHQCVLQRLRRQIVNRVAYLTGGLLIRYPLYSPSILSEEYKVQSDSYPKFIQLACATWPLPDPELLR